MAPHTLMVIDDDDRFTDAVRRIAEKEGFAVSAPKGRPAGGSDDDATEPDVIVMELHLREMDGIELFRSLAKRGSRAHIIVLSDCDTRLLEIAENLGRAYGLLVIGNCRKSIPGFELRRQLSSLMRAAVAA
jgi:DNA-binding NarL/FixJ family response regulator